MTSSYAVGWHEPPSQSCAEKMEHKIEDFNNRSRKGVLPTLCISAIVYVLIVYPEARAWLAKRVVAIQGGRSNLRGVEVWCGECTGEIWPRVARRRGRAEPGGSAGVTQANRSAPAESPPVWLHRQPPPGDPAGTMLAMVARVSPGRGCLSSKNRATATQPQTSPESEFTTNLVKPYCSHIEAN